MEIWAKNGKRIGICSAGDSPNTLTLAIRELIKNGCSIIFTSCRTGGETVEAVEDFYGFVDMLATDFVPFFKMKLDSRLAHAYGQPGTNLECNEHDARILVEHCEQLIK
jgi:hypothetical protein